MQLECSLEWPNFACDSCINILRSIERFHKQILGSHETLYAEIHKLSQNKKTAEEKKKQTPPEEIKKKEKPVTKVVASDPRKKDRSMEAKVKPPAPVPQKKFLKEGKAPKPSPEELPDIIQYDSTEADTQGFLLFDPEDVVIPEQILVQVKVLPEPVKPLEIVLEASKAEGESNVLQVINYNSDLDMDFELTCDDPLSLSPPPPEKKSKPNSRSLDLGNNEKEDLKSCMKDMGILTCSECSAAFETITELEGHVKLQHDLKKYVVCCNIKLDAVSRTPTILYNHIRWHLRQ